MGSTLGKVFIPLRGISHGMQGTEKTTVQDIENQIERGGDGPALNGPAPAPQGGQAGQSQIDKRAIKAIINVIKRKRSFVFMYEDVMNELEKLIPNKDERDEIIANLNLGIMYGETRHLYMIHMDTWSEWDIIAATPIDLDTEQLAILRILANRYDIDHYDEDDLDVLYLNVKNMRKRVYEAINAVIRAWSKRKPMDMVRILAEEYGVEA
jgi:hypothetical protein